MSIQLEVREEQVTAFLAGEIDHHSVKEMRKEIDEALTRVYPKELVIDFSGVSFMDSSGIGLVMGRYKLLEPMGGVLIIRGLTPPLRRVMKLAGIEKLAQIEDGGKQR